MMDREFRRSNNTFLVIPGVAKVVVRSFVTSPVTSQLGETDLHLNQVSQLNCEEQGE